MTDEQPDMHHNFVIFQGEAGKVSVEVCVQDKTVWLTQKAMGALFGVESNTVTYHLKEVYKTGELDEQATTRKIRVVQKEGHRAVARNLDFYNLDAIISVGYRVNSYQATQFRVWATKTLKTYMIKGFVMDDARMKQGKHLKHIVYSKTGTLSQTSIHSIKKYAESQANRRSRRRTLRTWKMW